MGSSTSSRLSPTSSAFTPVSSKTSRTAASSGSSFFSMWPPGGSHIPSLRWRCKSTFPSHTTNTATVKCLPVCSELITGLSLHQKHAAKCIIENRERRTNRRRVVVTVSRGGFQADRRGAGRGVLPDAPARHAHRRARNRGGHTTVQEVVSGRRRAPRPHEQLDQPPSARGRIRACDRARHERGGAAPQREARLLRRPEPEHEFRPAVRERGIRRGGDLRLLRLFDPARGGTARGRAGVEGRRAACSYLLQPLFSDESGRDLAPSRRRWPHTPRRGLPQ